MFHSEPLEDGIEDEWSYKILYQSLHQSSYFCRYKQSYRDTDDIVLGKESHKFFDHDAWKKDKTLSDSSRLWFFFKWFCTQQLLNYSENSLHWKCLFYLFTKKLMNFSFELQWAAMTGSVSPDAMMWLSTVFWAFFWGLAMVWMVVCLAVMVFMIISRRRVFKKAGLPGRGILIPVYNVVLMFKLWGMSGRRALSLLFPPLLLVVMIINCFNIAKKFGKHRAFGLGLLFVKIVFVPILAFDNSKRSGKKAAAKPIAKPVAKPVAKAPVKKAPAKKAPAKKVVKKVKTLTKKK